MADITLDLFETDVGKIQLRRGGTGDPLVYLHSAAGEGEGLTFLNDLAEHFTVYAPTFPGFNESEGIEQIDDMEDVVFYLLDLLDRLTLDAPHVVGLSLGGWMAAELATRYPDHLSSLVLINPAGLYIEGDPIKDIFGRSPAEMAKDLFADQSHPVAQMMNQMDKAMSDAGSLKNIPFELIAPQLKSQAAAARIGWNPYLHNPRLRRRLGRIKVPTLVIRAESDTLIPAAHARAYADEIPGAEFVEVANAAHMVVLEQPAEVAAIINTFVTTPSVSKTTG
jgi:pimeloyl-ACP methyl ester carboxylesterase